MNVAAGRCLALHCRWVLVQDRDIGRLMSHTRRFDVLCLHDTTLRSLEIVVHTRTLVFASEIHLTSLSQCQDITPSISTSTCIRHCFYFTVQNT